VLDGLSKWFSSIKIAVEIGKAPDCMKSAIACSKCRGMRAARTRLSFYGGRWYVACLPISLAIGRRWRGGWASLLISYMIKHVEETSSGKARVTEVQRNVYGCECGSVGVYYSGITQKETLFFLNNLYV
jgi:hypothetical protein